MKPSLEDWCSMGTRGGKGALQKITNFRNMPISISETLKKQIICGQIMGGTQLKQEEIANKFNVSLIPVREAIIQLEAQGLVQCERNKGAIVTSLSLDEMNDAFRLRSILETGAIKQAIPNLLDEHFEKFEFICDKMDKETNPVEWSRLNWLFHESIYMPTENQKLMGVVENLYITVQRYTMLQLKLSNNTERANLEHRDLIEACKDKNTTKAMRLIEKHIESERKALNLNTSLS